MNITNGSSLRSHWAPCEDLGSFISWLGSIAVSCYEADNDPKGGVNLYCADVRKRVEMSNRGVTRQACLSCRLQGQMHCGLAEPSEQTSQTAHSLPRVAKRWCVKVTLRTLPVKMRGGMKPPQISEDSSLLRSAAFPWREAKNQHCRRVKLQGCCVTSSLRNQSYQIHTLISLINQLKYCMGSCEALTKACTRQTRGSQMKLQNFCSEWFLPVMRLINVLVSICFVRKNCNKLLIRLQDVYSQCSWMGFEAHLWSCQAQYR